jgi:hypothetical protein
MDTVSKDCNFFIVAMTIFLETISIKVTLIMIHNLQILKHYL